MLGKILHTLAWSYRRGVELLCADGASCEADVGVGNRFEKGFGHHQSIMHQAFVACPAPEDGADNNRDRGGHGHYLTPTTKLCHSAAWNSGGFGWKKDAKHGSALTRAGAAFQADEPTMLLHYSLRNPES